MCRLGRRLTLIWSHGNAEDLGHVFFVCVQVPVASHTRTVAAARDWRPYLTHPRPRSQLVQRLGVNIVAYDYEGYGASTGIPRERVRSSHVSC